MITPIALERIMPYLSEADDLQDSLHLVSLLLRAVLDFLQKSGGGSFHLPHCQTVNLPIHPLQIHCEQMKFKCAGENRQLTILVMFNAVKKCWCRDTCLPKLHTVYKVETPMLPIEDIMMVRKWQCLPRRLDLFHAKLCI